VLTEREPAVDPVVKASGGGVVMSATKKSDARADAGEH